MADAGGAAHEEAAAAPMVVGVMSADESPRGRRAHRPVFSDDSQPDQLDILASEVQHCAQKQPPDAARKEGPGLLADFSASTFGASACFDASLGSRDFGSAATEATGPAAAASRVAARKKRNLKLLIKTSLSAKGPQAVQHRTMSRFSNIWRAEKGGAALRIIRSPPSACDGSEFLRINSDPGGVSGRTTL